MIYLEFDFTIDPLQPASGILIVELAELGFESFVETASGVLAYVQKQASGSFDFSALYVFQHPDFKIRFTQKELEQQNWNAEWERNFQPIRIGNDCMVRAPFHPKERVAYDLVIEPKMSFGTGHHETTHMILEHLLEADLAHKSVLDMGCGTGVLAIMAEKRGAFSVDAIDIDEWCYTNTLENVARNGCKTIRVFKGDAGLLQDQKYDVVLANINRNILLMDIPSYAKVLKNRGELYVSGFYDHDLPNISAKCADHKLEFQKSTKKNHWVSAKYVLCP